MPGNEAKLMCHMHYYNLALKVTVVYLVNEHRLEGQRPVVEPLPQHTTSVSRERETINLPSHIHISVRSGTNF